MTSAAHTYVHNPARSWLGVMAIALGAFSLVVTEFLPVGLLPGISRDLGVGEGTAGLTISLTAILGFVSAPVTAIAIGRLDRRYVLVGLTALLIVSSVMSAIAANFAILLSARILLGIAIGGFWAISLPAAAKLVPHDRVHAASSAVLGGISVGSVIAVPAGSYIGAYFDWRIAFTAASVLAIVVVAFQIAFLPKLTMKDGVSLGHFFGLLRSPKIVAILLTVIFIVGGQYAGYTFVTPYLEKIVNVDTTVASTLLFFYGVVAVIGNFVGGALAGRNLYTTVFGNVVLFLLSLLVLAAFAGNLPVAAISLLIWALCWGMAPVGTQLWLFNATRDFPEAAQAMNTSVFQLSIGLGSLVGGFAVDHTGLHSSMWLGAIIMVFALIMVVLVGRMDRTA